MTPEQWQIVRDNMGLAILAMKMRKVQEEERDVILAAAEDCLARCAKKFDPGRGFQFSTYAMKALFMTIHRERKKAATRQKRESTTLIVERHVVWADHEATINDERRMVAEAVALLGEREALVIRLRFGMGEDGPKTLDDVGKRLGVTKERARQIQRSAMGKLRTMLRRRQSEQEAVT